MKKALFVMIISLATAAFVMAAVAETAVKVKPTPKPTPIGSAANVLDQKIQEKMDYIKNFGKGTGTVTKEINVQDLKKTKPVATPVSKEADDKWSTLSALNIVGGMFEGGLVGGGIGLIGYSQSMNRNIDPVINGAVIGTVSGGILGGILSIYEVQTKKDYASDDLGFDIGIYTVIGSALGGAGGVISWGKTDDLENVSEGAGWGIMIGATVGIIMGVIEAVVLPAEMRGRLYEGHAMNIQMMDDTPVVACALQF